MVIIRRLSFIIIILIIPFIFIPIIIIIIIRVLTGISTNSLVTYAFN
jgi:hypothetical protein